METADESLKTVWGDPCNGEWIADKVVNYINNNLQIENPFSDDTKVKTDPDLELKQKVKLVNLLKWVLYF